MKNRDTACALRYHQATKHSEISVRTSAHYLDWENRPYPFKIYEGLPSTPLPRDFQWPQANALSSVGGVRQDAEGASFGVEELAGLVFFSAGLTRRFRHGGEIHYMRAASATGALYPIELYLVSGGVKGLRAGVYHFNPLDFSLVQLRTGDHRAELAEMSDESVSSAPATVVFSSFAWRNAWKYQARSYRHWFWDGGVIAANLLAVAASMGLEARVIAGFVDKTVNELLGLSDNKEAAVFLMPVGLGLARPEDRPPKMVDRIEPKVRLLSKRETEYPEIWQLHHASSLSDRNEVRNWVESGMVQHQKGDPSGAVFPLDLKESDGSKLGKLGDVILQRGSTRRFARVPFAFSQLSTILKASTAGLPLDYLSAGESLIDAYLIANAVAGLPAGSYFFNRNRERVEQLKEGQTRRMSAYLCLEQPLFGDASAMLFLMTRLQEVLERFGNRGYRAAQLEGGIVAGRIYLSAYALGLGASGTTFYDDAVTEFFSPHAKDKGTMIAVGIGVPAYKARMGKVLPQFP
jgi:SagB-type dehydrogenase family enzyme